MRQTMQHVDTKTESGGGPIPSKVFAKPFTLIFSDPEGRSVWIKVSNLNGLKNVQASLLRGEIQEIPESPLMLQLWGLLAEHSGFMRTEMTASPAGAGIMPLGEGVAKLHDEFTDLMGGDPEEAIKQMNVMGRLAEGARLIHSGLTYVAGVPECNPEGPPLLKPDGVNLTEAGERRLVEMATRPLTEADWKVKKQADNAMALMDETKPGMTREEADAACMDHKFGVGVEPPEIVIPVDSEGAEKLRQGISAFRGREEPRPISDQEIAEAEAAMQRRHAWAGKMMPFLSQAWILRNIFDLSQEQMEQARIMAQNLDGSAVDAHAEVEPVKIEDVTDTTLVLSVDTEGMTTEEAHRVIAEWKAKLKDVDGLDWTV